MGDIVGDAIAADLETAADDPREPTPEELELQRRLDAAVAENALLSRALTEKTAEADGLERERLRLTQAVADKDSEVAALADVDRQRNALVAAEREQFQRDIAPLVLERDAAVSALGSGLGELLDEEAKRWVDLLHLPWDGTAAIPEQLREVRRLLDGGR